MNQRLQKSLGWLLIAVSFVLWGLIAVVPFLGFTGAEIAGITTALVIAGEVTFWLGLLLAGRDAWERIKRVFWK